jgi:Skp family chaperone for outer membrane proteins
MRAVATKNIANRKASDFTSGLEYQGSLKAKSATVSQGNLLTGDTERIKRVRVRSASPKSAIMGVLKREAAKSGRPMAPRKPVTPRAPRYAYKKINRANANLDRASKAINKLEKRLEKSNTPKSQKALAKARKSAAVAFKARRLLNREPSRFYGRGSGRRVKSGAPRPSGTIAKPRGLKPGAIAARKAKAAASGARAARATTNYNRAQKAALEAQQRLNRRRSPKNQAAADRAQKTLRTAARAYRILVGLGGEKMATPRKPSPKGAGPRMKAARPAGTVAKPKGVKVEALAKEAGKPGKRLGRVAGPLPVDGVRRRGETTRNRSDVSGAVADIKALGLPIYKPRTARSPGQEGIRVRKGPRAGTVGIIAHTLEAFDRALALVKKQGGEILYQNKQGQAFTFRNPRRPKP